MKPEDTTLNLSFTPEEAADDGIIRQRIRKELGLKEGNPLQFKVIHRSIDARSRKIKVNLRIIILKSSDQKVFPVFEPKFQDVSNARPVYVIGAGPAGLFAALQLLEIGKKPIIIDRGKDVRSRRRDIARLTKEHIVNPESNYCFGEGGAGTFSDGKLYTRSRKRGDVNRVLQMLVYHGADEDILVNAHPHIGTNKLPEIISNIRMTIEDHGGEVRFDSKLTDITLSGNEIVEIEINNDEKVDADKVILATGHSARDIYELLHRKNIEIEAKPFSLGVRIEHPQLLIDQIQYNCETRDPFLPPATYSLVSQSGNRGVYSFCMCPGGIIAPCATSQNEIVVNGWSPSKRDQSTANSGIVVSVDPSDFASTSPLSGIHFQQKVEEKAWVYGGKTQKAPAQRLMDFMDNKYSTTIPRSSYLPGTQSTMLNDVLPDFVVNALKEGFNSFGKKMKGYLTNEAVLHAPESRTSSPVRIPRDRETLQHVRVKGLYPCGEGAGYAGGIVSAAIDGERCARLCN